MEPPQHDKWDKDRPEKGDNSFTATLLAGFIRKCVGQLTPVGTDTAVSIPGLSQFLPDDGAVIENAPAGPPAAEADKAAPESFDRKPAPGAKLPARPIKPPPPTRLGGAPARRRP